MIVTRSMTARGTAVPALPLGDVLYPPNLFGAAPAPDAAWWVLHTKPRAEKALGEQIRAAGIPFFLPQYGKTRRQGGRIRTSYLPLFPGYLFLRGTPDDRVRVLKTNLVANSLPVPDQETLHRQLAQVYRIVTHDPAACRPRDDPRIGSLVEITDGPFTGMIGRVTEVGAGYTFVVEVEFIGRGVSVPLDHWMFRKVSG
jgi:transcription antitermination factor NusG